MYCKHLQKEEFVDPCEAVVSPVPQATQSSGPVVFLYKPMSQMIHDCVPYPTAHTPNGHFKWKKY